MVHERPTYTGAAFEREFKSIERGNSKNEVIAKIGIPASIRTIHQAEEWVYSYPGRLSSDKDWYTAKIWFATNGTVSNTMFLYPETVKLPR